MDNLEKLLEFAELPNIIIEIEKIINKLAKQRNDKKIIRKQLYENINKKYAIDIPLKNFHPEDTNYWLEKKYHGQIAVKLAKIIQDKQKKAGTKQNSKISELIIPIESIAIPETNSKNVNNENVNKILAKLEKNIELERGKKE